MDPFSLPLLSSALGLVAEFVQGASAVLEPVAGASSTALAIVVLTLVVRLALLPLSIAQVRAEWTRRRLAPTLRALQSRYRSRPEVLRRKIADLYRRERVSPFAGVLPTLAQVPVVSLVYALFMHGSIGGHANLVLAASLGGVPLGSSLVASGLVWPNVLVFVAVLSILALNAWLSRRVALRLAEPVEGPAAQIGSALSWLSFATVAIGAVVPLAATIYLATTTTWTLAERALLRRRFWRAAV